MTAELHQSEMNVEAALEALLFVYGESMPLANAAKTLDIGEEDIIRAAELLAARYKDSDRGLMLLIGEDSIQLVTKPHFSKLVGRVVKGELSEELTSASLETLAIIAYAGPLTRSAVDYIRGVNSSFIVRSLMMRGLIERAPQHDKGHAYAYAVSFDFLKHLGFSRVEELPEYQSFRDMVKGFKLQI